MIDSSLATESARLPPTWMVSSVPTVSARVVPIDTVSDLPTLSCPSPPMVIASCLATVSVRLFPTVIVSSCPILRGAVVPDVAVLVVLDQRGEILLRLHVDQLRPLLVLEPQLVEVAGRPALACSGS